MCVCLYSGVDQSADLYIEVQKVKKLRDQFAGQCVLIPTSQWAQPPEEVLTFLYIYIIFMCVCVLLCAC